MADRYNKNTPILESPAIDGFAVTPGNTAFDQPTRGLYVGTGGNLDVQTLGNTDLTFSNVPDGALLPLRVLKVYSTSTASDIVGLF